MHSERSDKARRPGCASTSLWVQGSGKGTQAKLLADALDLEHISVGDLFRWNVQHHTKLGAQVRRVVAEGQLVPDELVEAVVHRRLSEHDWNFGFVIDGFPRNQPRLTASGRRLGRMDPGRPFPAALVTVDDLPALARMPR
jgi:adenylate kinase family enzyme